jgi:hypothetical protein
MEVSVMMAPKTSKSQVGADVCCGWGNIHMGYGGFIIGLTLVFWINFQEVFCSITFNQIKCM